MAVFQFAGVPKASLFSILSFMQMVCLLPLIGFNMASRTENFADSLDFAFYNFSFLPDVVVFTDDSNTKPRTLYVDQEREYLSKIGLEGGSAVYNLGKLIFVYFLIIGVYAIIAITYLILQYKKPVACPYIAFKWLFEFFTLGFFIRFFMITYAFVLLSLLTEISINNATPENQGSYAFAMIMFILCIFFVAALFVQWVFAVKKTENAFLKLVKEPLRGLKEDNISLLFSFL